MKRIVLFIFLAGLVLGAAEEKLSERQLFVLSLIHI